MVARSHGCTDVLRLVLGWLDKLRYQGLGAGLIVHQNGLERETRGFYK